MEKWLADRPDHAGEAAKQWLKELYQENRLVKNEWELGGRKIDLRETMPVLNVYAEADHIIPPPTVRASSVAGWAPTITPSWTPGRPHRSVRLAQIANPGGQGHRRLAHCARWLTTSDSTHPRPKETVSTQTQRTLSRSQKASARPTSGSSSTAARPGGEFSEAYERTP